MRGIKVRLPGRDERYSVAIVLRGGQLGCRVFTPLNSSYLLGKNVHTLIFIFWIAYWAQRAGGAHPERTTQYITDNKIPHQILKVNKRCSNMCFTFRTSENSVPTRYLILVSLLVFFWASWNHYFNTLFLSIFSLSCNEALFFVGNPFPPETRSKNETKKI